jgi:hypothetical protein
MKFKLINNFKNRELLFLLAVVLLFNAACGIVKNPLRNYSDKPFHSQEWIAGDSIERGRMMHSIYDDKIIDGKSQEDVHRLLGEPDKKRVVEGRDVWLYRVDNGHNSEMPFFPISFDKQMGTFVGRVKGGTISLLVAD